MTRAASNPLLAGLPARRQPDPCAVVIAGASGDLTRRKLFPALYSLAAAGLLPEELAVVGVARTPMSDGEFAARMREGVLEHGREELRDDVWAGLAARTRYVQDGLGGESGERALAGVLGKLDATGDTRGNRMYYLAVPPDALAPTIEELGRNRGNPGWTRLVIEKPFGHDADSACELNALLGRYFDEREVFRIDHYLGKETVQNLLVLRFANGIFEPVWNRMHIDHVQVTVAEGIGLEGRASFYERAGAVRDIVQNHLLQLVALTAMEPPSDVTADSVRNEKVKVLRAIRAPAPAEVVRGQYGPGFVEAVAVPGYREEDGVDPGSQTETYVAAKLCIDNWRWAGTPFYVRTGKRLPRRETTIAIQFKRAPHPPFELDSPDPLRPNVLLLQIQPDEGISLTMSAKVPGQGTTIRPVHMDFSYGGAFRSGIPEAYERLILDCLRGDATLFTRADEVEEQWKLVDAIVAGWREERPPFPNYAAGAWGPARADELLRTDGRSWRRH